MIDATHVEADAATVAAGLDVLDRFLAALNAGDQAALLATMHFPHYRLAGVTMRVWDEPEETYLAGFLARAGDGWHHTEWDFRRVIVAGPDKVHFDVQFTRYRADESVIGRYRSLYILTRRDGTWAIAARSSFAG
ncbi:MAG TPA: hypothetical protein VHW66_07205 [Stellaceae bacterium]|jgi:hypothetical protein|nr:hypothetical protein [Stellaceae bacterium]